jgi:cobalt/nickel transport system permease protein
MHIPDGILSAPVLAGLGAASAAGVALSAKRAEQSAGASRIPMLGVLGAFVFAAQMVNFPVGPGASGHLLGGALLAATLGPWAAAITMTAILLVQALVFQDGGVLALAANVFNMALVGVWIAWWPYRALANTGWARIGVFAGAFLSVTVSAALALTQIIVSGAEVTAGLLWLCASLFAITGLIEGAISVAAWEAIARLRGGASAAGRKPVWPLLAVAAAVMLLGVFAASQSPDVLEIFSEKSGAAGREKSWFAALMPDYQWPVLPEEWMRKTAAGLAGLSILLGLSWGLLKFGAGQRPE